MSRSMDDDGPWVPASYAVQLAELTERWGIAPSELLRGLGEAESLSRPEARLALSDLVDVVERARDLTGEPALGFHFGLQMRIASHGYLGLAAMTSPTVEQALEIAVRFAPTRTNALTLELERGAEEAALVLVEHADLGPARDAIILALLVGIWRIGAALMGREPAGTAETAIARPPWFGRIASRVPPVRFERPRHRLVMPRALLHERLVTTDRATLRLTLEHCERELEAVVERTSATERVRRALSGPEGGFRTLPAVARALRVSERTLKRRLEQEGTSFRVVRDAAKRDRALSLLRSDLTVAEVAYRLGYSSPANFTRAFVGWLGIPPSRWREAQGTKRRSSRSRGGRRR